MKIKKYDCYNLDTFLAEIIYKSLKKFKKHNMSVPLFLDVKHKGDTQKAAAEWNEMLDKMIYAFRELHHTSNAEFLSKDAESKKSWETRVKEGKQLFVDHFSDLWI